MIYFFFWQGFATLLQNIDWIGFAKQKETHFGFGVTKKCKAGKTLEYLKIRKKKKKSLEGNIYMHVYWLVLIWLRFCLVLGLGIFHGYFMGLLFYFFSFSL